MKLKIHLPADMTEMKILHTIKPEEGKNGKEKQLRDMEDRVIKYYI